MENLKTIKLMMERIESPRMTDTEYQKRKKSLNEGEKTSTAEVKMTFMDRRKDISKLAPAEKQMMNNVANEFLDFFLQPGNQAVGRINTYLARVFKEMEAKTKDTGEQPSGDENFDV